MGEPTGGQMPSRAVDLVARKSAGGASRAALPEARPPDKAAQRCGSAARAGLSSSDLRHKGFLKFIKFAR